MTKHDREIIRSAAINLKTAIDEKHVDSFVDLLIYVFLDKLVDLPIVSTLSRAMTMTYKELSFDCVSLFPPAYELMKDMDMKVLDTVKDYADRQSGLYESGAIACDNVQELLKMARTNQDKMFWKHVSFIATCLKYHKKEGMSESVTAFVDFLRKKGVTASMLVKLSMSIRKLDQEGDVKAFLRMVKDFNGKYGSMELGALIEALNYIDTEEDS